MPRRCKIFLPFFLLIGIGLCAQQSKEKTGATPRIDSIAFHLYTDSLKKGVYNYISVDGLLPDGRWMPLSSREIAFTSDEGRFEGNSLILDTACRKEKVRITATYIHKPSISQSTTIYIKKIEARERLKTKDEMLDEMQGKRKKKKKKNEG